jgi:hypothetical protein
LGGVVLGTGGYVLGACMPYHQPAAVAISVLWWGVYLGCLGASIGAWLGLPSDRTPAPPSPGWAGGGRLPRSEGQTIALKRGDMTPNWAAQHNQPRP